MIFTVMQGDHFLKEYHAWTA